MCGEQRTAYAGNDATGGSSPRVRGTDPSRHPRPPLRRFIPACAGNSRSMTRSRSAQTVHPRVCGEQFWSGRERCRRHGSSPRVRGTGRAADARRLHPRFIPACAGNRLSGNRPCRWKAVHPRVCGEQRLSAPSVFTEAGSSPRVRGTGRRQERQGGVGRFIPACAGNSGNVGEGFKGQAVHPRVCGEQDFMEARTLIEAGSSPRVRGTEFTGCQTATACRFIPACAGNSAVCDAGLSADAVHPRVCGEQFRAARVKRIHAGSSPRVRGTDQIDTMKCRRGRFIPACAGNSGRLPGAVISATVHPRVCGEQDPEFIQKAGFHGSSPRVRGTDGWSDPILYSVRFIPACAGNSLPMLISAFSGTVHPRVCGEQILPCCRASLRHGSSPRVRGTATCHQARPLPLRFIPACAGNSTDSARNALSCAVHPRVCGEQWPVSSARQIGNGSSPRVRGTEP